MTCIDFNFRVACSLTFTKGEAHACRFNHFFSTHGYRSMETIWNMRNPVSGRLQSKRVFLLRAFSCNGLCSTDLPGKPGRLSRVPRSVLKKDERILQLFKNRDFRSLVCDYNIGYLITYSGTNIICNEVPMTLLYQDRLVKLYDLGGQDQCNR